MYVRVQGPGGAQESDWPAGAENEQRRKGGPGQMSPSLEREEAEAREGGGSSPGGLPGPGPQGQVS